MENKLLEFLPVKEVSPNKIIRNQVIFLLIMLLIGLLVFLNARGNPVVLTITGIIIISLILVNILNTRVTTKITIDLVLKIFSVDYVDASGRTKNSSFNLLKAVISYEYKVLRSGGFWELSIYQNTISKSFKIKSSPFGSYSKEQLDEIYGLLKPKNMV